MGRSIEQEITPLQKKNTITQILPGMAFSRMRSEEFNFGGLGVEVCLLDIAFWIRNGEFGHWGRSGEISKSYYYQPLLLLLTILNNKKWQ